MFLLAFLYRIIPYRPIRAMLAILAAVSIVAGIAYGVFFFTLAAKGTTPHGHANRTHRTGSHAQASPSR